MRLWAKRRFNYRLNDHGLFVSGTNDRVMKAFKERDVFEKLQLVYKEPWERDCFDAVEPIEQNEFTELEMTEYEVKKDDLHIWVH